MSDLVGLESRTAVAQKICDLSKDCKLNVDSMRKKLNDLDNLTQQFGPQQRCKLFSLRLLPLNEEASKHAEKAKSAGRADAEAAAHTVNKQFPSTAAERAAVMGSKSKLQKTDRLLTHRRKSGKARGERVVIGGVALKSLSKDLLSAHRSDFCHI